MQKHILGSLALLVGSAASGCGQADTASQSSRIAGTTCSDEWYDVAPPADLNLSAPTLEAMLPIQYTDTDSLSVFFPVPTTSLQGSLPAGVYPLEFAPGVGAVTIAFLNHHSVSGMEPYREVSIGVPVFDSSLFEGYLPLFQLSMVVSSEQAIWVGEQGWGFPKILGNMKCHEVRAKGLQCMVWADDQLVMKVDVRTKDMVSYPESSLLLLTVKDGYLVRTAYPVSGATLTNADETGAATIMLGEHAIAGMLRGLGVGAYPSMAQYWTPHEHVSLDRGLCTPLP